MTIHEAAITFSKQRNTSKLFKFLDYLEQQAFANHADFLFMVQCSEVDEATRVWANEQYEEWQTS